MLAVLSLVSVLVFLLTRLAAGDPMAMLLGDQASLADIALARERYGLDQPLRVRWPGTEPQLADLPDQLQTYIDSRITPESAPATPGV
jgi:ABC-type dipeptide/oligopeptide/nickel transport system permease component